MRLEIKGLQIVIVGAFKGRDKQGMAHFLRSKGAHANVSSSLQDDTQVVVEGRAQKTWTPNKTVLEANARGLPVLTQEQAEQLAEQGFLELETETAEAPPSELIAEVRPLFDGPPTPARWSRLIQLVDACAPERLEELVNYLEPQLLRWPMPPHIRWAPNVDDPLRATAKSDFFRWMRRGTLCIAPPHWVMEAVTTDSPKLRLVHGISFRELKLNTAKTVAVLSRENLKHLKHLELYETKITKTFWKKAFALDALKHLVWLGTSHLDEGAATEFAALPSLEHLHTLALAAPSWTRHLSGAAILEILRAPLARHATTLSLDEINLLSHVATHFEADMLPALHTVQISAYDLARHVKDLIQEANAALRERMKRVELIIPDEYATFYASTIKGLDFSGVEELDLSGLAAEHLLLDKQSAIEEMQQDLLLYLPNSQLMETVGGVRLGALATPALVEALGEKLLDPESATR